MEKKSDESSSRENARAKARKDWKFYIEDLTSGLVEIITDEDNKYTKAEKKRLKAILNDYTSRLIWKAVLFSSLASGMLFLGLNFAMKYLVNK